MTHQPLSRRQFLALAGAGSAAFALGACGRDPASPVGATDPVVGAAEGRRRLAAARVHDVAITAAPMMLDLGADLQAATWGYDGAVPGSELRVRAGDVIRARFTNQLPEPTTIHWHGITIRNDMDGVPDLTQPAVLPGQTFPYEFTVPDPGTYWFHPHFGLHLDRGLYAPLVVEDPNEPGGYDREHTVVLDDWIDGIGKSPEDTLGDLRAGLGGHAAHGGGGADAEPMSAGPLLGGEHPGDVLYPIYLVNARRAADPVTLDARQGERLRLRLINVASDTPFRVALGGHRMTVTHADGFPVEPVTVDALMIGMAERYDVVVTIGEGGVHPLVAVAEAKGDQALAVVRSGSGDTPPSNVHPAELDRRVLTLRDLKATPAVALPRGDPDSTHRVVLEGSETGYTWTINGKAAGHDGRHGKEDTGLQVDQGERVRLTFENRSVMFHPMHLHGHHFQTLSRNAGARKDTVIVRPDEPVSVDFVADNPGQWVLHCHNLYHMAGGMQTTVSYVER